MTVFKFTACQQASARTSAQSFWGPVGAQGPAIPHHINHMVGARTLQLASKLCKYVLRIRTVAPATSISKWRVFFVFAE